MPPVVVQNRVPPVTSTDAELIDWFLNKMKLSSGFVPVDEASFPVAADIRHISRDLREFLIQYPKVIPSCEDLKTPFDYWAFLEPVFTPPLRLSMLRDSGGFAAPPTVSVVPPQPAYHWKWALDDAIDTSMLTEEELGSILASIPTDEHRVSEFPRVSDSIVANVEYLNSTNKALADLLVKLRKWIGSLESSDLVNFKVRTQSMSVLFHWAETVINNLRRHQLLDSIEEVHCDGTDNFVVVVDDGEAVVGYSMSASTLESVLIERAAEIDSIFPFNADSRFPQLGPFCHICRQRTTSKPCTGKKLASLCQRRFCNECLLAYNWPQPTAEETWKCPICLKLCTCDRCIRNVFLKSLKSFLGRNAEAPQEAFTAPCVLFPQQPPSPATPVVAKRLRRSNK